MPSHYSSIEYYTIDDNNDGTISSTWNTSGTNTIFSHTGVLIILKPYVSTGIDVQVACDSYTWINGLTYFSSNNVATDTLVNYLGNDSIVILNLTINNSSTGTDIQTACDSYTWINGNTYTSSNSTAISFIFFFARFFIFIQWSVPRLCNGAFKPVCPAYFFNKFIDVTGI